VPTTASQAIRLAADFHWHPVLLLNDATASIGTALGPAGAENTVGVVSATFLKDPSDPAWKNDPAINDWLSFMDKYHPNGDKGSSAAFTATRPPRRLRRCLDNAAMISPAKMLCGRQLRSRIFSLPLYCHPAHA
jgi:hypothetical protein